jgi:hypothetical protein
MSDQIYECALSGVIGEGDDFELEDGLGNLPAGWFEVTIKRRYPNPEYVLLQQAKQAQVEIAMRQLPADAPETIKEAHRQMISLQTEALFHSFESTIQPFWVAEEVAHVSPVEPHPEMLEVFNEIRDMLGFNRLEAPVSIAPSLPTSSEQGEGDDADDELVDAHGE